MRKTEREKKRKNVRENGKENVINHLYAQQCLTIKYFKKKKKTELEMTTFQSPM